MGKKIWIVNYYSSPPEYASNSRHLEFAKHLRAAGYEVIIFSSGFLRDKRIHLVPKGEKYTRVQYGEDHFVHIGVRAYMKNGVKRMLSIFQFAWRVYKYRKHFEKPDIILHNIHAPFDYPVVWCAKRMGAKYIAEAWDLWPYYFVAFGLIGEKNPAMKLAYTIERKMYEKADRIIFSFEGGFDYLRNHLWTTEAGGKIDLSKVYYINNGVNLRVFNVNKNKYRLDDEDLLDDKSFKVIYLGSVRLVNNVKQLIDAAKLLVYDSRYKFLIYGNGVDKLYLKKYCKENKITNVLFKEDWIPLCYVPYVVSCASLNVMNYQKKFGDYGVSSGKMFQYLAAGKPILCNIKLNYDIIEANNLGVAQNLDTPEKYAKAIGTIANQSKEQYEAMCERVCKMGENFDYDVLSSKLLKVLEML